MNDADILFCATCRTIQAVSREGCLRRVNAYKSQFGQKRVAESGIVRYRASRETGLHTTGEPWDEGGGAAVVLVIRCVEAKFEPCYSIEMIAQYKLLVRAKNDPGSGIGIGHLLP